MIQPPRLLETGTAFERELLESARSDTGSDDGFRRALVAMGAGVATTATASTAAASTTAAGTATGVAAGASGGSAATILGGTGAAVVVKWVGVSAALIGLGSATASATSFVRSRMETEALVSIAPAPTLASRPPITRPDALPAAHATAAPALDFAATGLANAPAAAVPVPSAIAMSVRDSHVRSETSAATPLSEGAPSMRATRMLAAAPPTTARSEDGPPPTAASIDPPYSSQPQSVHPAPTPSSLEAEVAALDRVRASLASRDPAGALHELDTYGRAFPASMLGDEALVLRIDALVASGDRDAAQALSRRFLVAHPGSPHAAQLLRLLDHSHNP